MYAADDDGGRWMITAALASKSLCSAPASGPAPAQKTAMGSSSKDKEKHRSSRDHKEKRVRDDGEDGEKSSRKDRDKERSRHGDRHHRDKHHSSSRSSKSSSSRSKDTENGTRIIDDNPDDEEELWVEKATDEVGSSPSSSATIKDDRLTKELLDIPQEPPSVANIPTRESLKLTSHALPGPNDPPLPKAVAAESIARETRDEWMLDGQAVIRQSDNLTHGGTFSLKDIPTGIARPNTHDTVDAFTDGFGEGDVGTKGTFGGDFFGSMGTERKRKEVQKKQPIDAPKMSSREINKALFADDGSRLDSSVQAVAGSTSTSGAGGSAPPTPGSSGSNWRMMKLRRVYETAEEEKRSVEEVGLERFGTVEAWEAVLEERKVLDGKSSRPPIGRAPAKAGDAEVDEFGREIRRESSTPQPQTRYIFNEPGSASSSRPPSRAGSFRRPGSAPDEAGPSSRAQTPQPSQTRTSKLSTPIPSVFTPPAALGRKPSQLQTSTTADDVTQAAVARSQNNDQLLSKPPMSPTSLNKLQAKVLRMRLMGGDVAELKELEATYEAELQRSRQGDAGEGYFDTATTDEHDTEVRVLPTLDGRGRLYDVGTGQEKDEPALGPGNKRKRKEAKYETRDPKTGELLRINADDDTVTLEELLREEKFGGGAMDQKNMDYEMATRIAADGAFKNDLDYMDDSAERLARKKVKTEAQKKMFAIQDYAKTKKALDSCQFCYQDTDTATVPPQACMVALGTRAYLSLPLTEPLVDGHALIVPTQHHLSSLEADDDTWDEIKNFMKTLMQMHAEQDKGVLFYETITSLKGQRHTYIEAVPIPWEYFEQMPGYFHEGIATSEAEWSQHQKLIDFSKRPGGFRRAMVPNLPYFMVHWDYKGEKGYGHVIEGAETATGEGDTYDFDEGAKGGGEFSRNFAAEIIGNVLDLEPRKWRRPRRMDRKLNDERVKAFRKHYDKFDWTKMLAQTSDP